MGYEAISTNNAPSTSLVVGAAALGTITDGELLVGWSTSDSGTSTPGFPAGFDPATGSPIRLSSFDANTFALDIKVASSESGDYTFTSTGNAAIGGMVRVSGRVPSTTPHRVSTGKSDSSNPSPQTIASPAFSDGVTTAPCTVLFVAIVDGTGSDSTFAAPAGYTLAADICQTATFERQFMVAYKDNVAAGFDGVLSGSATGNAGAWACFTVALAAPATCALTGTATASITEADIVSGGKTIIATLTNDTYVVSTITPQIGYVGGQVGGRAGSTSTANVNFALTGGDVGFASATPQVGDYVVITVVVGSQARNPACAISGYTALGLLNSAAATQDTSLDVSYKRMTATPDTSFTLPSTGNVADAQRYTIQVFRNVDPTTPLDVTPVSATGSATGRPNPGSITPSTSGAYVLICAGGGAATGAAYTAPANYTTNFLTGSTADTNDAMVGSGYRAWTSGAEDPAVYTGGTTNATDSWCAYTIALRPAPATTPFADARQDFINGFDSAQSEGTGWDAVVKAGLAVTTVVRTSDTVATLTLSAFGTYNITATETITGTIPASILQSGSALTATPTFTISASGGGGGGRTFFITSPLEGLGGAGPKRFYS